MVVLVSRLASVACRGRLYEIPKLNSVISCTRRVTSRHRFIVGSRSLTTNRIGPDRVLPANTITTTVPGGAVEIRDNYSHPSCKYPPISLWTMLDNTVQRCPDNLALAVKRNGEWINWTYKEYQDDVRTVAKAFIKLGLKPHFSVNVLAFNCPEWHIAAMAAVAAGGLSTGIYTTNTADATRYVAQHSRANIMVVDDQEQLDKVEGIRDQLTELLHIIQIGDFTPEGVSPKGTFSVTSPDVITWPKLLEIGKAESDSLLQERLEKQAVNQPAVLIYTSGTTGNPKGVILSQDNITWCVRAAIEHYGWGQDCETGVSYLPLSHIAAQIIDIYIAIQGGASCYFADKLALQGTLLNTLAEVQPTRFFGVPRVYEKIHEKMLDVAKTNTGIKKTIATWAKKQSFDHYENGMAGTPTNTLGYKIAKKVVFSKVHEKLGFTNCKGWYSSAAPLSPHTFQYFQSLDMPILELFGSSETCGPQTASLPGDKMRCGSVGLNYPHFETAVMHPDQKGVGEVVTRGRHVCLGYIWEEDKTNDLIDDQGWVHSGDLGYYDADGFLYITGRMKEILVTGGGENVAPVPIEDALKGDPELSKILSHAMVVGDKRKHLAVIFTLKTVLDKANQPTDVLSPEVQEWLQERDCHAKSAVEVIKEDNEDVKIDIMNRIKKVNKKATSNAQKVHKFMIAPREFSVGTGELTPTTKLKRHFVLDLYEKEVQRMYEYETQSSMW